MDSSQAGQEFFPRARASILSAYIQHTNLYVGMRAPGLAGCVKKKPLVLG